MTNREKQFGDLIFEYKKIKTYTQRCADKTNNQLEKPIINSIVRSLEESILYMRTGVSPLEYNLTINISKKPEMLIANDYLANIAEKFIENKNDDEEFDKLMIDDLLRDLTTREKECYLLTQQSLFSQSETAEILGVKRTSVLKYIERARVKIAKRKKESLFVFAKGWGEEQ